MANNDIELNPEELAEWQSSRSGGTSTSNAGVAGSYIRAAAITTVLLGGGALVMGPDIINHFSSSSSSSEGRANNTHRLSPELRSDATPLQQETPYVLEARPT